MDSIISKYKQLANYKKLKIINDDITAKLKDIYDNNILNLKEAFAELQAFNDDIDKDSNISWVNNIQYLDYKTYPKPKNKISLSAFKNGEYKDLYATNSATTEKSYATRIQFFTNNFKDFNQYKDEDDLTYIIKNNRLLLYNILKYHNDNNNSLSTLNRDLKCLVRVVKLLLGETDELRFKYSVLQVAITELEQGIDDLNALSSQREKEQFIPYENIFKITINLENEYYRQLALLPDDIKKDGSKHPKELFNLHQLLLAIALYTWDFPSRHEKLSMDIITDENEAKPNKNYVLIPKQGVCKFIFNEIVKSHTPISYNLNNKSIKILNDKLNKLLKYSFKTYPRKHLFINKRDNSKASVESVARWLKDGHNIGIDAFRSAFVSYYLPKFNNRENTIMAFRMRTSKDILTRSYLKQYAIKDYKDVEVENVEEKNIDEKPELVNKNREKFRKYYQNEENKQKHRERVKANSKKPDTYKKRYIRELNNKKLKIEDVKPDTIAKYDIKVNENGVYY